jgi:hypothetical protein
MSPVRTALTHGRRSLGLSRRRDPLRIAIGRRRTRSRTGGEKFVTQVRLADAEAIVVPWTKRLDAGRRAVSRDGIRRPGSRPVRPRPEESLV